MTNRRGFINIELPVVIGIIGIVVAILATVASRVIHGGRVDKCKGYLKTIGEAVPVYEWRFKNVPVMRDRPVTDVGVNVSPTATTRSDLMYGSERPDGTIEDWSALGDNAMQNAYLLLVGGPVKENRFQCAADKDWQKRPTEYRFGWMSPYQYSYSMHWPYPESEDGSPNPAPFAKKMDSKSIIFADRNPGGPVGEDQSAAHGRLGLNVLRVDGSVENHRGDSKAGINGDDIYTNALGIPGGIPQHEYDTSLNLSPR
jgi:hypothetical protein